MVNLKSDIQKKVVEEAKDKSLIILNHCTGLGKSFSAFELLVDRYYDGGLSINKPSVLLMVAEVQHKVNWENEIQKYKEMYDIDLHDLFYFTMECYASMKNHANTHWDVIILDECHHLSPARLEYLTDMSWVNVIALSATLTKDQIEDITCACKMYHRTDEIYYSKITLKEAIAMGVIPKPEIYLIPLKLDNTVLNAEVKEGWGVKSKRKKLTTTISEAWKFRKRTDYPDMELRIKGTQQDINDYLEMQIAYWKNRFMESLYTTEKGEAHLKLKWMRYALDRKTFLGSIKTQKVKQLMNYLKDKRTICFCSSVKQAKEVGGKNTIYSTKRGNDKIIQSFQEGKIDHLYCVGMLTEGQNLKDIEAGVIVQLDGVHRPFIQKSGRVLRSTLPQQYIFYFKNTRDEEYLNSILEKEVDLDTVSVIDNFEEFINENSD